jgi:transketolase
VKRARYTQHEAASLAGHLRLGKLIYLYDDNHISIDGPTELAFTEDRCARFAAYGWHVQQINGHDRAAVASAIRAAQAETERPSFIACRTHIGYGSPNKAGTAAVHGEPLGPEETRLTKERLGWTYPEPFAIPAEALAHLRQAKDRGNSQQTAWENMMKAYGQAYPQEDTSGSIP